MPAAIPVVAGEAVLAAEVLAAEAAAAAAAEAASVAAAEAASIAAAEAAATAAAEQAATAAATEAATAATATGTSGLEALNLAQTQTLGPLSNQLPGQLTADQIAAQYTSGIPQAGQGVQVAQAGTSGGIDALLQSQAAQAAPATSSYTGATSSFAGTPAYAAPPPVAPPPAPSTMLDYNITSPVDMPSGASGLQQGFGTTGIKNPGLTPDQMAGPSDYSMSQGLNYGSPISAAPQTPVAEPGFFDKALDYIGKNKLSSASMGLNALNLLNKKKGPPEKEKYSGPLSKFSFNPDVYEPYEPQPPTPYQPRMYYAGGGSVEMMSNANAVGANTGYPMADINKGAYATPYQTPISQNIVAGAQDVAIDPYTGQEQRTAPAPSAQFAGGGISSLGTYSDYARGGRMLKGPGDGMSDDIPATIAGKQPARLANEEFVVPADVVSHLGNGSSEAGAKALYKMMDRVRQARTGNKKQGKQINPEKYLA
jgi:hypothetical protein